MDLKSFVKTLTQKELLTMLFSMKAAGDDIETIKIVTNEMAKRTEQRKR